MRPSCAILCAPTRQWFSRAFILAEWAGVGRSTAPYACTSSLSKGTRLSSEKKRKSRAEEPTPRPTRPTAPRNPLSRRPQPWCHPTGARTADACRERRTSGAGAAASASPPFDDPWPFPPWHFGCGAGARRATDPLAHPRPRHHVANTPRHLTDVGGMPGGMHARRCRRQSATQDAQPVRCAARGLFFERQTRVSLLTAFPLPVGQLSDTATTEAHRPAERRLPRRRCRRSSRRRRRRPPRRRC